MLRAGEPPSPAPNAIGTFNKRSVVLLLNTSNSTLSLRSNKVASNPKLLEVVVSHLAFGLPYWEALNPAVAAVTFPSIG